MSNGVSKVGGTTVDATNVEPTTVSPTVPTSSDAVVSVVANQVSTSNPTTLQKLVGTGVLNPGTQPNPLAPGFSPIAGPPPLITVNPNGTVHLPEGSVVVGYSGDNATRLVTNGAASWSELINFSEHGLNRAVTPALRVTDTDISMVVRGQNGTNIGVMAHEAGGLSQVLAGNFNTDPVTGVTESLYMQYGGDVVQFDGTTAVAWTTHSRGEDGGDNLFVSFNDGSGWQVTGPVSVPGGGFARHPSLLVTPTTPRRLFLSWNQGPSQEKVWLSEWNFDTSAWQPLLADSVGAPRPIENNPAFTAMYPVMAFDDNTNALYVAYREQDSTIPQPPYYTSMHVARIALDSNPPVAQQLGGPQGLGTLTDRAWPGETEIKKPENFNRPQIAIVGGQVHVAFTEGPDCSHGGGEVLFVKRYNAGTGTWNQVGPELAVSSDDVASFGGGQYSAPVSFLGSTPVVPVMVRSPTGGLEMQLRAMVNNAWRPVDLGAVTATPGRYFHPVLGVRSSDSVPMAPGGLRVATYE